jgi:hypothetical protein
MIDSGFETVHFQGKYSLQLLPSFETIASLYVMMESQQELLQNFARWLTQDPKTFISECNTHCDYFLRLFPVGFKIVLGGRRAETTGSSLTSHDPGNQRHSSGTETIDLGIINDRIKAHLVNTLSPICVSFDPDSKITDESAIQSLKHSFSIILTDAGMRISCNDWQPLMAHSSIRVTCDPDSNVNDASDVHPLKHP